MKIAKQWNRYIVRADTESQGKALCAAGVMLMTGGKILLLKRAQGDHTGTWAFPGGKIEKGETPEQAAIRECQEEIAHIPSDLKQLSRTVRDNVDFTTFTSSPMNQFEPALNAEHDAFSWVGIDEAEKMDLHPCVRELLGFQKETRKDSNETELDVAYKIRDQELDSPQYYGNIALFDVRISGTGVSYRKRFDEYVFRDPSIYLNDEFLTRCQGLPVIFEHPVEDTLNSKEFSDRIIGTILLPYIKGSEVWGIAKIYDNAAAKIMADNQVSTSPAVVFRDPAENEKMDLGDGQHLLIEGKPSLLDHLAIVPAGVWDKGGEPSGVKSSNVHVEKTETSRADSDDSTCSIKGETTMSELNPEKEVRKDDDGGMGEVLALLKSLDSRMSALELAEKAEATPDAESMPAPSLEPVASAPIADNAKPSPDISAVEKRMDAIEASMPKPQSEDEQAKMADAQCKADSVYAAFGDAAPRPMQGESLLSYRKRLVAKMQSHSVSFKDVKLSTISDESLLDAVEKGVYADALEAASSPARIPEGMLIETTKTDVTGRRITEFKGSPSGWTRQFKAEKRLLVGINKSVH